METGSPAIIGDHQWLNSKAVDLQQISPEVFVLSIEPTGNFLPGQVIALTTNTRIAPRLYSICSAPHEKTMQILFSLKPDGELTPLLAQLKAGNTIWASAPFGAFLGNEHKAWWIAAGTGIAPFRSMMRSGLAQNKRLVHGGRFANQFYFQEEFIKQFGSDYIRCCSQETGEGLFHGRLTSWLKEQELPPQLTCFLCGSAEMVVETRDILIAKGVGIEKIISEIYF